MSDSEDSVIDGLIDVSVGGLPDYERYSFIVNSSIDFCGKSLDEWIEVIKLPEIRENMSLPQLESFNFRFVELNEIIMTNLAKAKSSYCMATAQYNIAISRAKGAIMESIKRFNTSNPDAKQKRMPGVEALHQMAEMGCTDQYSAMKIAEMFFEFWQIAYQKMQSLNTRLTSINILKNIEYKQG